MRPRARFEIAAPPRSVARPRRAYLETARRPGELRPPHRSGSGVNGSVTRNRAPPSGVATSMSPPWRSTSSLAIVSPNPFRRSGASCCRPPPEPLEDRLAVAGWERRDRCPRPKGRHVGPRRSRDSYASSVGPNSSLREEVQQTRSSFVRWRIRVASRAPRPTARPRVPAPPPSRERRPRTRSTKVGAAIDRAPSGPASSFARRGVAHVLRSACGSCAASLEITTRSSPHAPEVNNLLVGPRNAARAAYGARAHVGQEDRLRTARGFCFVPRSDRCRSALRSHAGSVEIQEATSRAHLSRARRSRSREPCESVFLANMSHELRTPLALILGPTRSC